jgi:hypothetical protein
VDVVAGAASAPVGRFQLAASFEALAFAIPGKPRRVVKINLIRAWADAINDEAGRLKLTRQRKCCSPESAAFEIPPNPAPVQSDRLRRCRSTRRIEPCSLSRPFGCAKRSFAPHDAGLDEPSITQCYTRGNNSTDGEVGSRGYLSGPDEYHSLCQINPSKIGSQRFKVVGRQCRQKQIPGLWRARHAQLSGVVHES